MAIDPSSNVFINEGLSYTKISLPSPLLLFISWTSMNNNDNNNNNNLFAR